jgi:hypothetical protein
LSVLWMGGTSGHYVDYRTAIRTLAAPSHVDRMPGRYFATPTVTDADGDRDTFVIEVVAR